jgi:hypothetical protein
VAEQFPLFAKIEIELKNKESPGISPGLFLFFESFKVDKLSHVL